MRNLIKGLPYRESKPRNNGLNMIMDKGLSCREIEDMLSVAGDFVDIVKLGFGTSVVSANLDKKLSLYREANIPVYFGGTLLEAFVIRGQLDDYIRVLDKYKMEYAEVSDGSMTMAHDDKCEIIHKLSKKVKVLSEVGSKDANLVIPDEKWSEYMQKELAAGSWKLIAEARESGTVGIYDSSGKTKDELIREILSRVKSEMIIWEAPLKNQQIYFIKLLGANVNLGNIAPNEIIPLETLRLGLRGDTFMHFYEMYKK